MNFNPNAHAFGELPPSPPPPPLTPTTMTNEPWIDPFTYETISDGPSVLPILIGTIGMCLGILAMLLLLMAL